MSRVRYHQLDVPTLGLALFLVAFGLMMLWSAGAVVGFERFGQADYFVKRQFFNFVIGLVAFLVFLRVDYHVWRRWAVPMLLGAIVLLILVFLPSVGFGTGGAHRWISLGSFLLQPSEIAKLAFLLYLAVWLEKRGKGIQDFLYGFLPFATLLGTVTLLVMLQPDMGTVSIIFLVSLAVYFVAGAPLHHVFGFVAGAAALFLLLVKIAPYRTARLAVFLHPELDPQGIGYHINQALLAIGSGGLFGVGLGHSRQKYNFLPEVTGDSIFAVIAEELGFVLVVGLIVVFLAFLVRGLRIARAAPDAFGRYIATGIAVGIVGQALINIGALSGILPLTGITLPFISAGGSSLIVTMAMVGLLLNISRQTRT